MAPAWAVTARDASSLVARAAVAVALAATAAPVALMEMICQKAAPAATAALGDGAGGGGGGMGTIFPSRVPGPQPTAVPVDRRLGGGAAVAMATGFEVSCRSRQGRCWRHRRSAAAEAAVAARDPAGNRVPAARAAVAVAGGAGADAGSSGGAGGGGAGLGGGAGGGATGSEDVGSRRGRCWRHRRLRRRRRRRWEPAIRQFICGRRGRRWR